MLAHTLICFASLLVFRHTVLASPSLQYEYRPVLDGPDPVEAAAANARLDEQARSQGLSGPASFRSVMNMIDLSALESPFHGGQVRRHQPWGIATSSEDSTAGDIQKRAIGDTTTVTSTIKKVKTVTRTRTRNGQLTTVTATSTKTITSTITSAPTSKSNPRFPYGKIAVRGVNLGGWLILECWITPTFCLSTNDTRVVDEYTFGLYMGRARGTQMMQQHWSTFITEEDIRLIAKYGLNHIRIPIGYWAFDISEGEPYIQGAYPYLLQAIEWARKYNLKVLVDLHGAPGSQNGFDNSGRAGNATWPSKQSNLDRTTAVLQTLASKFSDPSYASVVTIVELLNEPASYKPGIKDAVKPWYFKGYQAVRFAGTKTANNLSVMIQDAFQGLTSWYGFMQPPDWQNVLLDTHIYVTFNKNRANYSDLQLQKYYCGLAQGLNDSNKNLKTIVGEFTPPRTDCAYLAYPPGVPSHYVISHGLAACNGKTLAVGPLSAQTKTGLKKMFELQTSIYEANTAGWIMWTWKQEIAQEWSYLGGVQGGWIPAVPTKKTFGNQCAQFS